MTKTVKILQTNILVGLNWIVRFLCQHADYILFIILLTSKVLLFEKFIHASFMERGLIEYLRMGMSALFFNHDIFPLQQGIYMVSFGSVLLISFWTLFLSHSAKRISLLILDILITFIIFSNLVYYRYYSDLISIPVLLQAFQLKSVGASVANLIQLKDIVFCIDLIILIPVLIYTLIKKGMPSSYSRRTGIIAGIMVFILGYFAVSSSIDVKLKSWGKDFLRINWWNACVYNATGLLGFHGYDAYRYVNEYLFKNNKVSPGQIEQAGRWFSEHGKSIAEETPFYGLAKGKNVMVIQGEALQSFVIGKSINGKEVTPNINQLIKDSMYFNNFYHQTAQGTTSDAELLTQCSLYPLSTGSVYIRNAGNKYDSLPKSLRENGYETAAFHANEPSFWNRYSMYKNIGFERFFSKNDYKLDENIGLGLNDQSFFFQSIAKIKEMKQPFYSFLITLTSHYPYNYTGNFKELKLGNLEGTDFGGYIHSIHYVDDAVGKMIETMKKEGLWDKTVFIMYGDHDTKLPDKGELAAFIGSKPSTVQLEQIKQQVPLIIHLPKGEKAGLYSQAAGQLDLAPTILHLLGIRSENSYMMGSNILDDNRKLTVFRNGSFTNGYIFFIPSKDQIFKHGKCYNLLSGKQVSTEKYEGEYQQAMQQLHISDNLIYGDLIRKFEK